VSLVKYIIQESLESLLLRDFFFLCSFFWSDRCFSCLPYKSSSLISPYYSLSLGCFGFSTFMSGFSGSFSSNLGFSTVRYLTSYFLGFLTGLSESLDSVDLRLLFLRLLSFPLSEESESLLDSDLSFFFLLSESSSLMYCEKYLLIASYAMGYSKW
jgi:hypothetical protein